MACSKISLPRIQSFSARIRSGSPTPLMAGTVCTRVRQGTTVRDTSFLAGCTPTAKSPSNIYLTDIPQSYVHITSGLGEVNPASVLIMPMLNNGTVEGLLELVSFNPFQDFEIAFIGKLAENIASAIATLKVNESIHRLLEQSQQQAEELRAQEAEIRRNMKDMSATQRRSSGRNYHICAGSKNSKRLCHTDRPRVRPSPVRFIPFTQKQGARYFQPLASLIESIFPIRAPNGDLAFG